MAERDRQLAAQDKKLDDILGQLQQQPYANRAMLDEVLAHLGDDTSEQVVAAMLDRALAEIRGKSITDADELRRLLHREVTTAVARATGEPVRRDRDEGRLTKTETAYKLAFESDKKVIIGAGQLDPFTGERSAGRVLDPDVARAEGYHSWRDWYLMDDLAARTQAEADAARYVETYGDRPRVLSLPGTPADADADEPIVVE